MVPLARILIFLGIILLVAGGLVYLLGRTGLPIGRLPGDIRIQTENFTCFFPLTTMILLSVVLTILLNVLLRIVGRK
jgi:hypothetical protein